MADQYIVVDINKGNVSKYDTIDDAEIEVDTRLDRGDRKSHIKVFFGHEVTVGTTKLIDPGSV